MTRNRAKPSNKGMGGRPQAAVDELTSRWSLLVDNMYDAVIVSDPAGRIIEWNPAAEKLYGYSKNEMLGKTAELLNRPGEREGLTREILQALESRGRWTGEVNFVRKDGSEGVSETIVLPIPDDSGGMLGVISFDRDITERRRSRSMLDQLNRCFLSLGSDYRANIRKIVETASKILGGAAMLYNRLEKDRGMLCTWGVWPTPPDFDFEDTPDGHICYNLIRRADGNPTVISNLDETPYRKTDPNVAKYGLKSYLGYPVKLKDETVGSLCLVDTKIREFTNLEIKIIGMLAGAVAIEEERKAFTDALLAAEGDYHTLFENALVGIAVIDAETLKLVTANRKLAEMYGYDSVEELLTADVLGHVHPDDRDEALRSIREDMFQKDLRLLSEYRTLTRDGKELWVRTVGARIAYRGKTAGLCSFIDITDRVRAEIASKEREKGFREQNARLLSSISSGSWYEKDLKNAVAEILEACSEFIRTERISVWLYDRDYTRLRCFDLFERSRGVHSEGEELNSADFPSYTNGHVRGRAVGAEDVLADPRTRDIPAAYYRKHDIRSLLDSPIWIHGRIGGLLSFEQVGSPRSWSPDDERIATTMSALLALCFERDERRRAEAGLAESKRFLDSIFDSIQDGISLLNTDLTIRHTNRMMNEWYGTNIPLEGKKCYQAFQNREKPCDPCPTLRCLHSGMTEREIVPGLPGSPAEWLELFCYPVKDPATGKVTGVVEFVRDITGRKRAEEELRERERRLDLFFSQSLHGFFMCMLDEPLEWHDGVDKEKALDYVMEHQRMTMVNQAMLDQYGARRENFVGITVGELFRHDLAHARRIWRGLFDRGRWHVETSERKMDGTPIIIDGDYICLYDDQGRITGHFGVQIDITERKRMEEELRQAHKMESIGRLAGGVAHDFNNMLQTIIGNAELASGRVPPGSPISEHLREILSAAQHSAELARQLLAFARKQVTRPRIIDLNKTVAPMVGVLRRLIRENATLSWKPGRGAGRVEFDPDQLNQVLANLVVNARDAIGERGEITISTGKILCDSKLCRAHPGSQPGEHALLSVADNGRGMDREKLERIFDPFFTTKEVGEGTGLGLSTVYGIVRKNNGFIEVESAPGRGSVFRIHLPSRRDGEEDEKDMKTGDRKSPPARKKGAAVLLVEDDTALLKLCRKFLEGEGYTVLAAAHPKEALKLADEHPGQIDLLVTDVVMPGLSGPELWRRLAAGRPELKLIFISGYADDSDIRYDTSREGARLLRKPFALEELKARIAEVLASAETGEKA